MMNPMAEHNKLLITHQTVPIVREVDVSKAVHPGQPNTVAVRVESNNSPGGIWQPVWVVYPTPSTSPR